MSISQNIDDHVYYDVHIRKDWRTGKIYYTPYGIDYFGNPELVMASALDWDGNGFAFVGQEVLEDYLFDRHPDICDVIEIDEHNYVVLERDIMFRGYRVLRETPEAHRLAIWYLTYMTNTMVELAGLSVNEHLAAKKYPDVASILDRVYYYS